MSTTTSTGKAPARTVYGNWVEQKSPGIGSLGLLGTGVALGSVVVVLIALLLGGFRAGAIAGGVMGVVFVVVGTPLGRLVARRGGYMRGRWAGEHQWRSGVFSRNTGARVTRKTTKSAAQAATRVGGTTRLPGMLGRLSLLSKDDPFGQPFVVIKNPLNGGLFTMVARCVADGPWMQDQERLDAWVGNYASVLNGFGQDPALVCAKAISDTAPDPGNRLTAMVRSLRSQRSPSIARAVMDECAQAYPATSSENVIYVELTYRGRLLHRKGHQAQVLSELARRVPQVMGQLASAGGGAVTMLTAAELAPLVRVAYDPASQPYLEQAALNEHGTPTPTSATGATGATAAGAGADGELDLSYGVGWHEAGPVAAQDFWDHYVHDSGRSISWEMYGAPRSAVDERLIGSLLLPNRDFTRKRVALIYRPMAPEKSMQVSETDANAARFMASQSKKRTTAMAGLRMQATDQSRQEVASGAVMVRFSLMVTATVASSRDGVEDLDQAAATIKSRGDRARIDLRRCYGSQAAAFATTLPIGLVPWEHTVVPDTVRELM